MSAEKAVQPVSLEDILTTEDDILSKVELKEHIFEVRPVGQEAVGFASLYDLKSYIFIYEDSVNELEIRAYNDTEWTTIFKHNYFQRRKPQLISTNELKSEGDLEFYILRQGQKAGPYEKLELTNMVDDKELLLNDMVSYNGGHTWIKLYQLEGFDRRTLCSADQLPGMPEEDIFTKAPKKVSRIAEETEALSGLAYLGNVKRGKAVEKEKIEFYQEEISKKNGSGTLYKFLLIASVVGITYFLYNIKSQLTSPFKPENAPIGEQAELLKPVSDTENTPSTNVFDQGRRRGGKFETREFAPIKPRSSRTKSFTESPKYQAVSGEDSASEENIDDSNYYYDNSSPMELDPVRSQVSKENYDAPAGEPGPLPTGEALFEQDPPQ